jgi:hypothetical protein
MTTSQAPVVWYEVTEVTSDDYTSIYRFLNKKNAQNFLENQGKYKNLEGVNTINTALMYFEDKDWM